MLIGGLTPGRHCQLRVQFLDHVVHLGDHTNDGLLNDLRDEGVIAHGGRETMAAGKRWV
jgi:hypothetical protein